MFTQLSGAISRKSRCRSICLATGAGTIIAAATAWPSSAPRCSPSSRATAADTQAVLHSGYLVPPGGSYGRAGVFHLLPKVEIPTGAALMDVGAAGDQAPLVALDPPGVPLPLPGQPLPGFPPAQLVAIVKALSTSQAFAAAIEVRVFATPASAMAEVDEVILAPLPEWGRNKHGSRGGGLKLSLLAADKGTVTPTTLDSLQGSNECP